MTTPSPSDIAITGYACRLPGAADTQAYWQLLLGGGCAVHETPTERWSNPALFAAAAGTPGKLSSAQGGFIADHDRYDAAFFGISQAEAECMDPQQLLALQVAWHALEDARQRPSQLAGGEVGVFIGATSNDFENLVMRQRQHIGAFTPTGINGSVIAARISYALDLRGPSMTINTACSSSLVAVHEACLHLRTSQCDMTLAGGVNLMLTPEATIAVSQAGMMAPDGRCKTFDDSANGYVRGEGCGIVVLKRLDRALADGDRIHAVIKGSAVNQDGLTNGLTAPNRQSQEALIRRALAQAGLQAQDIGYVEAHGTGTKLGDPIEVNALKSTYGLRTADDNPPCHLGAVKAQIGHLEPAAGIAGLIKTLLQMRHRTIVGQIGITRQNKLIKLDGSRLRISPQAVAWGDPLPAAAGISAFSYGGTNCHVIVAPPPQPAVPQPAGAAPGPAVPLVLPISARSDASLDALRAAHLQALSAPGLDAAAWCAAAAHQRDPLPHRKAFVGDDLAQLRSRMAEPLPPRPARTAKRRRPEVVFLFSGQGSQYAGMGRGLYERFPVFAQTIDSADAAFRQQLGLGVTDLLWGPHSGRLDQTDHTQPALYVLQVALTRLWAHLGVRPDSVVGHSIGEYAAAQAAGVFSFEQGLHMVFLRGRLMQDHAPAGHMLAVRATPERINELLPALNGGACVAAFNGPQDLVLAVQPAALAPLSALLAAQGVQHVKLKGNRAFHCVWMAEAAAAYRQGLADREFLAPRIALIDNVSGADDTPLDAAYWARQIVEPVRFCDAVRHARVARAEVFVEIGAGNTLLGMASRAAELRGRTLAPSMAPGEAGTGGLSRAVAALFEAGLDIEWQGLHPNCPDRPAIDLPLYPFDAKRVFDPSRYGEAAPLTSPLKAHAVAPAATEAPGCLSLAWEPLDAAPPSPNDAHHPLLCLGPDTALLLALRQAAGGPVPHVAAHGPALAEWLHNATMAADAVVTREALAALPSHGLDGAGALAFACVQLLQSLPERCPALRSLTVLLADDAQHPETHDAALIGALKSAALERPGLHLKVVRVAAEALPTAGPALLALARLPRGGEYRLSPLGLTEPVLTPRTPAAATASAIHTDRAYLITGGTGSIGLQVARGLVARGARQLVLVSRQGGSADALRQRFPEFAREGVELSVWQADLAEPGALQRLLATWAQPGRRLGGIFHAAGVSAVMPHRTLNAARMADALSAKLAGTQALGALEGELAPDFIVVFSSISALWGAAGLTAYAAANRWVDAWAEAGGPGEPRRLAINWGPWRDSAMVSTEAADGLHQVGIEALPPEQAVNTLFELLDQQAHGRVAVCNADWRQLGERYAATGLGALFRRLMPTQATATVPAAATPSGWRDDLRAALAALLNMQPGDIPPDEPLHALGIDSLKAIEFKKALETRTGLSVPATVIFDYPTLRELEGFLAQSIGPAVHAAAPPAAPAVQHPQGPRRDIAIVGLGCRLPGHSDSPEAFWQLLLSGRNPVQDAASRWQSPLFAGLRGDAAHPGRFGAAFIDGIEAFDAKLFNITPLEARSIDPQQRLALELAWRCFERAGYRPSDVKGQRIGTYLGVAANEYHRLCNTGPQSHTEGHPEGREYQATGNALNVVAGRVAYHFGLRGPAVAIDTACSSSLVALHQAISALRAGECDLALAGGLNVLLDANTFGTLGEARMLSPSWRCATFDASADGYVRGEGGAMFLLKPLADAQRDGDEVLAVLKGSAINQDGRSASLTAPHGPSQVDVMRRALADAGLPPTAIDWVEAHGTGTPLGDPIELRAIDTLYGSTTRPLVVGAVKSNIGHLESASGAAGLMKIVLSLAHQTIAPNLHFGTLNPHIDGLRCAALTVPTQALPWHAQAQQPRRAAISSFGFSGTNAHLVVEEAPARTPPPAAPTCWVLPLAAHTEAAFSSMREALQSLHGPDDELALACRQAQWLREPLRWRAVAVGHSADELRQRLRQAITPVDTRSRSAPRLALLLDGLAERGDDSLRTGHAHPAFAQALQACHAARPGLAPAAGGAASHAWRRALQYAWARLWFSAGLAIECLGGEDPQGLADCLRGDRTLAAYLQGAEPPLGADATQRAVHQFASGGGRLLFGVGSPSAGLGGVPLIDLLQAAASPARWLELLAALYTQGFDVDWRAVGQPPRTAAPETLRYPMDKQTHWAEQHPAGAALASLAPWPSGPHAPHELAALLQAQTRAMHEQLAILENELT